MVGLEKRCLPVPYIIDKMLYCKIKNKCVFTP
jgi:hypothetical protein